MTTNAGIGMRCGFCNVTGNHVVGGFGLGISMGNESGGTTASLHGQTNVVGNRVDCFEQGIRVQGVAGDVLIASNHITVADTSNKGIEFFTVDSNDGGDNTLVCGNRIDGTGSPVGGSGIRSAGSVLNVQVIGNMITGFENSILATDSSGRVPDSWFISDNYFWGNTNDAPSLTGTNHVIVNNREGIGAGNDVIHHRDGDHIYHDNIKLFFGTGSDASIIYDGSDLKIDPQVVGSGNADIANGNLDVLTGTVQEAGVDISPIGVHDIWVGASAMRESTTGGCATLAKIELATDQDIETLDFDGAAIEAAQFNVAFPKNWDAGVITATFYWSSSATDTDDVDWRISGVSFANSELLTTAYGSAITVTDAYDSAANDLAISAATANVTIAGATKSEMQRFLVERDGASDTMTEDARLHGIMLHITTDAATAV